MKLPVSPIYALKKKSQIFGSVSCMMIIIILMVRRITTSNIKKRKKSFMNERTKQSSLKQSVGWVLKF